MIIKTAFNLFVTSYKDPFKKQFKWLNQKHRNFREIYSNYFESSCFKGPWLLPLLVKIDVNLTIYSQDIMKKHFQQQLAVPPHKHT